MANTRARIRSAVSLILVGCILGALTGCQSNKGYEWRIMEKSGFTNIRVVDGDSVQPIYNAELNGCTFVLFITQDKELWIVRIVRMPDGKPFDYTNISPESPALNLSVDGEELRANPYFQKYCP